MADRGHLRLVRVRLDTKLCVPMSAEMRRQLEDEARAAGYRSVSGYVRDVKLGAPLGRQADGV